MSSLCPGTLFSFPGFNKKSTPVPPQTTSEELSKRYRRQPFNGRPWPHGSPVAGVYDVEFSSTKMILFNNKRRQSKLRGNNDPKKEESLSPDPNRHYRASSPVSRELHQNCYNSMSPHYYQPKTIPWINYTERPPPTYEAIQFLYTMSDKQRQRIKGSKVNLQVPMSAKQAVQGIHRDHHSAQVSDVAYWPLFVDGSLVNPKRHTSCCVPTDPLAFKVGVSNERRPHSRASLPPTFRSSTMLNHPDLKRGEKKYIGSIARIYSAQQMIKLKQKQYNQLLILEMEKGYHTPEEYNQYKKFIELGRQRQYARPSRAKSAPAERWAKTFEESLFSDEEEQTTKKSASSKSLRMKSPTNSNRRDPVKSSQSGKATGRSTKETPVSKYPTTSEPSLKPYLQPKSEVRPRSRSRSPPEEKKEEKGESSDTSESVQSSPDRKIHREGYDRPLSRIGHIPEDSKRQKSENSEEESKTETMMPETLPAFNEESDIQSASKTDTSSSVRQESSKSDSKTPTDDQYKSSTDETTTGEEPTKSSADETITREDPTKSLTEETTTQEDQTEYKSTTDDTTTPKDWNKTPTEDTKGRQTQPDDKISSDTVSQADLEGKEEKKELQGEEEKAKFDKSESEKYISNDAESKMKPLFSKEKVSFRKDSVSEESDKAQSTKRRDSLSDDEVPAFKRDPDELEY